MAQSSPMNGGHGIYSYTKNSSLQREGLNAATEVMKEALIDNLDVKTLLCNSNSNSNRITITDLGCSVGPNTFLAMQTLIEILEHKHHSQNPDSKRLEFQVLFNDIVSNDFNTLFASLPGERNYFAAGVPGSFYGRLFPCSSIHVVFSSSSLHWLSRAPQGLQNAGRIHYTGAPEYVVKAYVDQYEEDMGVFLSARAEEMVGGGVIVMMMPGVPDHGTLTHDVGLALTFLGSLLMDMVKEGVIEEDKVDSFNIPQLYPNVKQMKRVVEKNGDFEIVKMEIRNARPNPEAPINIEGAIMHLRAFTEGSIAHHFGSSEIVEHLFKRAMLHKTKFSHMLYSSGIHIGSQLFAVLQRKLN